MVGVVDTLLIQICTLPIPWCTILSVSGCQISTTRTVDGSQLAVARGDQGLDWELAVASNASPLTTSAPFVLDWFSVGQRVPGCRLSVYI